MRSLRVIILALCICVGTVWLSGCDASEPEASDSHVGKADVSTIKSANEQERQNAAEAIKLQNQEVIQGLIKLAAEKVEHTTSRTVHDAEYIRHHTKYLAIQLLGDLRASEAVPILIDNLEYRNPNILVDGSYLEPGQLFIAAESLSKIGMPAVGPVINKLAGYSNEKSGRSTCCWILKDVLGIRLAKLRLEIAIEERTDPTEKKNLTAALPYFKTQQEKAAEERARRKKAGG